MNRYIIFSPWQLIKFHIKVDVLIEGVYKEFERDVSETVNPNIKETYINWDTGSNYIVNLVLKTKKLGFKLYITNPNHIFVTIKEREKTLKGIENRIDTPIYFFPISNELLRYTDEKGATSEILVSKYPFIWQTDLKVHYLGFIRDKEEIKYKIFKL